MLWQLLRGVRAPWLQVVLVRVAKTGVGELVLRITLAKVTEIRRLKDDMQKQAIVIANPTPWDSQSEGLKAHFGFTFQSQ